MTGRLLNCISEIFSHGNGFNIYVIILVNTKSIMKEIIYFWSGEINSMGTGACYQA